MQIPAVARYASHRPLSRRALQTRQKLMKATMELLASRSYRDVTVTDVAKAVGTSAATFYQYFPGIEGVVLEESRFLAEETKAALTGFEDGSWSSDGLPGATRLVNAVLDGWSTRLPVMRVLTAVAAERDPRFVKAYHEATTPVGQALTAGLRTAAPGHGDKELVHALVHGLTAAAGYENARSVQGLTKVQRRRGLARLIHAAVTTDSA